MLGEIERVAALHAEELAVDAAAVAIVAANDLVVANAQRGPAAIGAMRADGADVLHFPGPGLIAIRAAGERAHRADVDAGAAFVAFQMIVMVRNDLGDRRRDWRRPARSRPCLRCRRARSGSRGCSAARRNTPPATIAFRRRVNLALRRSGSRPRRSGTPCPAVRTRRPCRTPGNRADDWSAGIRACPCAIASPRRNRCGPPCLRPPAACSRPAASESSRPRPGTCGRRPAACRPS